MLVTYGDPSLRLPYLLDPALAWSEVAIYVVNRPVEADAEAEVPQDEEDAPAARSPIKGPFYPHQTARCGALRAVSEACAAAATCAERPLTRPSSPPAPTHPHPHTPTLARARRR